jgi:type III secretory pathway component EscR
MPTPPSGQQSALSLAEDTHMHRFLLPGALVLSAILLAPVAVTAENRDQRDRRYYDRDARDYHSWNSSEDRAYRAYLQENRREYRDFHKVKRDQQRQYFRWRHDHPDNLLFKLEIR